MATPNQYVQTPTFYQAGSGNIVGATSVVLTSFTDIYNNVLTMSSFGTTGYITLEPDTSNEEGATFTGITSNANGTYTLTGIKTIIAQSPYTQTSGLVRAHAGGTKVVVTDNVAFWNTFGNKANDETVTGQWTFTNTPIVPGTVSDASTTVKGVSKTSVAPAVANNPIVVGTNDPRVPIAYSAETGTANTYVITPSPVITAYAAGQVFSFVATNANTGASTLNVNGLGAKTINKDGGIAMAAGDILANQMIVVEYDGTNMQTISRTGTIIPTIYRNGVAGLNTGIQTIAHGLTRIPKKVRITGTCLTTGTTTTMEMSIGSYDGLTNTNVWQQYFASNTGSASFQTTNSTSYAIKLTSQTGVITVDATNITITWTGSLTTGTGGIMWEVEG